MKIVISIILLPILLKVIWTEYNVLKKDSKKDHIQRANYLLSKIVSPKQLINEMPDIAGPQFQGEWAIYTCAMTAVALANMSILYSDYKEKAIKNIDKLIEIVLSPELREYDKSRWGEDPLESLVGKNSHISYLSLLAWMIGRYKQIGGDSKYDAIYHSICEAMNRRILQSPSLLLPTYPYENIYLLDMFVAIVALNDYSLLNDGKYKSTVDKWITKAKTEWIDEETGLLSSLLSIDGKRTGEVKGSYSALNCFYLSLVDHSFAEKQYKNLKKHFKQTFPLVGIKEYNKKKCMFGFDIDAGPIICNLSPSGTAFVIGAATSLNDKKFRKQLLRTAEIAGHSVTWKNKTHYLLANYYLVGEAIVLAMKTSIQKA